MKLRGRYVVPQVNVYASESFDEAAESMFGYQTRVRDQAGAPFDARTVRALAQRRYLTVSYLVDRWRARAEVLTWDSRPPEEPVTFIGREVPEGLPHGSEAYPLDRSVSSSPSEHAGSARTVRVGERVPFLGAGDRPLATEQRSVITVGRVQETRDVCSTTRAGHADVRGWSHSPLAFVGVRDRS